MKIFLLLALPFFCLESMQAQALKQPSSDIRIGLGLSLLGTGDLWAYSLDAEFNKTLNTMFAYSFGLASGKSDDGGFRGDNTLSTTSFFQTSANIYLSPFRNNRKNDLRIGTGLSFSLSSSAYVIKSLQGLDQPLSSSGNFERRAPFGVNIIIENTFALSNRFLLGLKAFSQPYFNGDINTGILLKFGVQL